MAVNQSAIDTLLNPSSVAIIGASRNPRRMSGVIVNQIKSLGFKGSVYPVNPECDEIAGLPCVNDITDLKSTPPDVAVLYLPADRAVEAARECADMGVKGLVVLSAGFGELGEHGRELQRELTSIAQGAGMAVMGPNTAGMANFNAGFVAYGSTGFAGLESFQAGGVAILSSSGGLGTSLFSYCQTRQLGVSHLLGIGNEGVTTAASYLDALVRDPQVHCVAALLEAIREPKEFLAAADRAATAGKPVILMKQGRSAAGRRSIQNHTGAFGGEYGSLIEACRSHGITLVQDLESLADQAMLFERMPRNPKGYRAGVFSLPGGGTSLMADAAGDAGIELPPLAPASVAALGEILPSIATPNNPLDPTAGFSQNPERLKLALETFSSDESFDLLVFFQCTAEPVSLTEVGRTLVAVSRAIDKPVICVWDTGTDRERALWAGLEANEIALFTSAGACFRALRRHQERSAFQEWFEIRGAADFGPLAQADPSLVVDALGSSDVRTVLDAIGIGRPAERLVTSADEAADAAVDIADQVALKLERPAITHKTELGGVRLGARGGEDARTAYEDLVAQVESSLGSGAVEAVLVQQMVPCGVEILVGVHSDPQFGPLVTVAHGGVLTELLGDAVQRLAPLSRTDVQDMLSTLRSYPLLTGFRGSAPADIDALTDVILRLSWAAHLARETPLTLELNPVIVRPEGQGAIAVDWAISADIAS